MLAQGRQVARDAEEAVAQLQGQAAQAARKAEELRERLVQESAAQLHIPAAVAQQAPAKLAPLAQLLQGGHPSRSILRYHHHRGPSMAGWSCIEMQDRCKKKKTCMLQRLPAA